jgi:phospholipid/cholesterol/gamma-HCH transport system permease protein
MARLELLQKPIASLGRQTINITGELGQIAIFFTKGLLFIFHPPFQFKKITHQVFFIGWKSSFVVCLTGAFTGMVLGIQGYYSLAKFGSTGFLGPAVALSLIRELGPVLAAVMVTGRAGSAIAAEIGIMRISEQIDALETMDINPIRFLISPKIAAALISFPLLTAMFDVVGIFGGWLTASILLDMNPVIYFSRIESSVVMADISGGFLKSVVFSVVVVAICCYQGYFTHTRPKGFGAEGVSSSTTTAVVQSCVLILVTDYVLTSFLL